MSVRLSGFTDEVSSDLETQIEASRALGWSLLDLRTLEGENVVDLTDELFEEAVERLSEARIEVSSFGSALANWGRSVETPLEDELTQLRRAARRMRIIGTKYLRVMSYRMPENAPVGRFPDLEREILHRLRRFAEVAEDEGIVCLHENCETWGGQSVEHTLRIVEETDSDAFRLVFDTGNPVGLPDVRGEGPYPRQDALEFYETVREHIAQVHIKDGRWNGTEMEYTLPGEGQGKIEEILQALARDGYDGVISIEPHTAMVFHDPDRVSGPEERWNAYIEYGRRTEELLRQVREEVNR